MEALVEVMKKLQPDLSEEYVSSGYDRALLIGAIMAALVIFTAIATKKAKGFGIVTGIMQLVGALGAHLWIVNFSSMEMMKKIVASSQDKIDQMVSDYYAENIPKILLYLLGIALFVTAAIMLIVFIIKVMKCGPKVCGIFALILAIARLAFFPPINSMNVLKQATEATQTSWDGVTATVAIINVVLVALIGVFALCKKKPDSAALTSAEDEISE